MTENATYIAVPIHFKVMPHGKDKLSRAQAAECVEQLLKDGHLGIVTTNFDGEEVEIPFVQLHNDPHGIVDIALSMDADEDDS
jgi:hypothetical protein